MAIRFGVLELGGSGGALEFAGTVLLLINGRTVASGTWRDMLRLSEEKAGPGDWITFVEAGWDDDEGEDE